MVMLPVNGREDSQTRALSLGVKECDIINTPPPHPPTKSLKNRHKPSSKYFVPRLQLEIISGVAVRDVCLSARSFICGGVNK